MYGSFVRFLVSFYFNKMCNIIAFVVLSVVVFVPYSSSFGIKSRYPSNRMLDFNWPEPDPDLKKIPHEDYCHYYYNKESEDLFTVRKCPKGEMFDYHFHECKETNLAQCWSRQYGKHAIHDHIHSKWRKHFKCPFPEGNYPDIFDCNKYIVCLDGVPHHKHCAPFKQFDKIRRHCVHVAACASSTDAALVSHMCPYSSGKFAHPYDCSAYYNCHKSEPSLGKCGENKLFDEERRHCKNKNLVSCGQRHNPYEMKTNQKENKNSVITERNNSTSNIIALPKSKETINPANVISTQNVTKTNLTLSMNPTVSEANVQPEVTSKSPSSAKNIIVEATVKSDISQNGSKERVGLETGAGTTATSPKLNETSTPDLTIQTEVVNGSETTVKTNKSELKVQPVTVDNSQTSVKTIEPAQHSEATDKSQISTESAGPVVVGHSGSTINLPISVKPIVNESPVQNSISGNTSTANAA